jgi:hypothetical protein
MVKAIIERLIALAPASDKPNIFGKPQVASHIVENLSSAEAVAIIPPKITEKLSAAKTILSKGSRGTITWRELDNFLAVGEGYRAILAENARVISANAAEILNINQNIAALAPGKSKLEAEQNQLNLQNRQKLKNYQGSIKKENAELQRLQKVYDLITASSEVVALLERIKAINDRLVIINPIITSIQTKIRSKALGGQPTAQELRTLEKLNGEKKNLTKEIGDLYEKGIGEVLKKGHQAIVTELMKLDEFKGKKGALQLKDINTIIKKYQTAQARKAKKEKEFTDSSEGRKLANLLVASEAIQAQEAAFKALLTHLNSENQSLIQVQKNGEKSLAKFEQDLATQQAYLKEVERFEVEKAELGVVIGKIPELSRTLSELEDILSPEAYKKIMQSGGIAIMKEVGRVQDEASKLYVKTVANLPTTEVLKQHTDSMVAARTLLVTSTNRLSDIVLAIKKAAITEHDSEYKRFKSERDELDQSLVAIEKLKGFLKNSNLNHQSETYKRLVTLEQQLQLKDLDHSAAVEGRREFEVTKSIGQNDPTQVLQRHADIMHGINIKLGGAKNLNALLTDLVRSEKEEAERRKKEERRKETDRLNNIALAKAEAQAQVQARAQAEAAAATATAAKKLQEDEKAKQQIAASIENFEKARGKLKVTLEGDKLGTKGISGIVTEIEQIQKQLQGSHALNDKDNALMVRVQTLIARTSEILKDLTAEERAQQSKIDSRTAEIVATTTGLEKDGNLLNELLSKLQTANQTRLTAEAAAAAKKLQEDEKAKQIAVSMRKFDAAVGKLKVTLDGEGGVKPDLKGINNLLGEIRTIQSQLDPNSLEANDKKLMEAVKAIVDTVPQVTVQLTEMEKSNPLEMDRRTTKVEQTTSTLEAQRVPLNALLSKLQTANQARLTAEAAAEEQRKSNELLQIELQKLIADMSALSVLVTRVTNTIGKIVPLYAILSPTEGSNPALIVEIDRLIGEAGIHSQAGHTILNTSYDRVRIDLIKAKQMEVQSSIAILTQDDKNLNTALIQLQNAPKKIVEVAPAVSPRKPPAQGVPPPSPEPPNAPPPPKPMFFKKEVAKRLMAVAVADRTINPKVTLLTKATPQEFGNICVTLGDKVKGYKKTAAYESVFKNVESRWTSSKKQDNFRFFDTSSSPPDKPIVEVAYVQDPVVPAHKTIEIISSLRNPEDEALILMVISAKETLEKLGKNRFKIENCENDPETALKIYLLGKSLGLEPYFKDRPGREGETLNSINHYDKKLYLNDKEETFKTLYEKVEKGKPPPTPKELRDIIDVLQREHETPKVAFVSVNTRPSPM